MVKNYASITGTSRRRKASAPVPQTSPIPGREQEMSRNYAGGYSFDATVWVRLNRFIILGSEGTTYTSERDLTKANLTSVKEAIAENPMRVVDTVVDILSNGRAFKVDPGLYVLSMVAAYGLASTDQKEILRTSTVRSYALSKLSEVIRNPTHLYMFANYVQGHRGWGRSLRDAFGDWYLNAPLDRLAMHAWKYKSRDGFSHYDLMRLTHPTSPDPVRNEVFRYMVGKSALNNGGRVLLNSDGRFYLGGDTSEGIPLASVTDGDSVVEPLMQIQAAEKLLHISETDKSSIKEAVRLITTYNLTHEAVNNDIKGVPEIWEALAQNMPVIATVRNLGKMTSIGLISSLSEMESLIVDRLTDPEQIKRSRAHPMQFLIALKQYEKGRGDKGSLTWNPTSRIKDALDQAFYLAFKNVPVTGKRILLAVDDSGSMQSSFGNSNMSSAEAAAAMALVTLRTEPNVHLIGFATGVREVDYSRFQRVSDLMKLFGKGEGTDLAVPFHYLKRKNMDVDAVITYTDNNTWAGWNSPSRVLEEYRKTRKHVVRSINVSMESNHSTNNDPNDIHAMELVGMDANTPAMIGAFVAGDI